MESDNSHIYTDTKLPTDNMQQGPEDLGRYRYCAMDWTIEESSLNSTKSQETFPQNAKTGCGAHAASCCAISRSKADGAWNWTFTWVRQVPRLRMREVIPPFPHMPLLCAQKYPYLLT